MWGCPKHFKILTNLLYNFVKEYLVPIWSKQFCLTLTLKFLHPSYSCVPNINSYKIPVFFDSLFYTCIPFHVPVFTSFLCFVFLHSKQVRLCLLEHIGGSLCVYLLGNFFFIVVVGGVVCSCWEWVVVDRVLLVSRCSCCFCCKPLFEVVVCPVWVFFFVNMIGRFLLDSFRKKIVLACLSTIRISDLSEGGAGRTGRQKHGHTKLVRLRERSN
jgi:hypothetical protein